jgi:DNA-binding response OmpR family regulator
MGQANILLVEGKRAGEDSLYPALCKEGYKIHILHTGAAAISWIERQLPDLVLFDAASMRSSGVRNCRRLRRHLPDTPIIHTRPAGEPKDSSAGADIYLVRPYTARKVLNRVRALLPADELKDQVVRAGALTLFRSKPSVDIGGRGEKRLTPKLAQLLEEFLRHPNQVLSRRQLMQNVWDTNYIGDTRTLDVHIRWVREAIEDDPAKPRRLTTVRGVGYVFHLPSLTK